MLISLEAFLDSVGSTTSRVFLLTPRHASASAMRICLHDSLHACTGTTNLLLAYPPVSLHRSNNSHRYWNINQLSIDYASQPRLRSRLTLGGRPFPRKPLSIGVWDSHPHSLLTPAFSLLSTPALLTVYLLRRYNAPLPLLRVLSFGN